MAVFIKELRKHIFVHPGDQHKLEAAIKIALLKDRRKYSDRLNGALLDVHKIQVVGDRHLVVNGYVSMEVVAEFEVFCPSIGTELEGIINKKNGNNYGCVVKGLFNAYLHAPSESGLVAKEGDNCTFTVTKVIVNGDMVFMNGRLKSVTPLLGPNDVKSIQQESLHMTEEMQEQLNSTFEADGGNLQEEVTFESIHSPKKKNKKKSKHSLKEDESKENGHHSPSTNNSPTVCSETRNTDSVKVNGVIKSIKMEPVDNTIADSSLDSKTKSKKKIKKKRVSESDNNTADEFDINKSVKLEPVDNLESTILSKKKHKKKLKHRLSEDESIENRHHSSSTNSNLTLCSETHNADSVKVYGKLKSIKKEPVDNTEAGSSLNSKAKSKKKCEKKKTSESDNNAANEIGLSKSVKSEPVDNLETNEAELSEDTLKTKKKKASAEDVNFATKSNSETSDASQILYKKKRKRKVSEEAEISKENEHYDRKPVIGVDIPEFSPSKMLKKCKEEKISPKIGKNVKSELDCSPPKKKIKREK